MIDRHIARQIHCTLGLWLAGNERDVKEECINFIMHSFVSHKSPCLPGWVGFGV